MIRPGIVPYPAVNCLVRISCPLCAELPYCPVIWVFSVEKGDEAVEGVSVGSLWVCLAWARAGEHEAMSVCRHLSFGHTHGMAIVHIIRDIKAGTHVTMMLSVT